MPVTQHILPMMSFAVMAAKIYGWSGELATSMLGYFYIDRHCQALHHSQATAGDCSYSLTFETRVKIYSALLQELTADVITALFHYLFYFATVSKKSCIYLLRNMVFGHLNDYFRTFCLLILSSFVSNFHYCVSLIIFSQSHNKFLSSMNNCKIL